MGTEYFLVKPDKKELFYLGRRISCLNGVPEWIHKQEAGYATWETVDDVFFDIFENSRYFLEGDMLFSEIMDICWAIYDWCDAPVYLDNDCNDYNNEWLEWKETCSVYDYINSDEWLSNLVVNKIPKEYWIEKDHILYEKETLENYIIRQ